MKDPLALLEEWLVEQLDGSAKAWFQSQVKLFKNLGVDKDFDICFGMIPRRIGKNDLILNHRQIEMANNLRPGWNPTFWSVDVATRILLLSTISRNAPEKFEKKFKELHRFADVGELMALYGGLPLYQEPQPLTGLIENGLRTNVKAEFQAISHFNPFPFEYFSENTWNNMVLKSLFVGVMLDPIYGLDKRSNENLAKTLRDYAHERWAAKRFVSPELWRCIGPFATESYLDDFEKIICDGKDVEKKAIYLALSIAPDSKRKHELLKLFGNSLTTDGLTWRVIAEEMLEKSLATTNRLNFEVELKNDAY